MAKIIRVDRILRGNPTYGFYRDEFEGELQHEEDAAKLAFNFALFLRWTRGDANNLHEGALIHDIGKLVSDGGVLYSPIKSPKQAKLARELHVDNAVKICDKYDIRGLRRESACEHHEVFDGKGYPGKKRRYEISPEVRVISIVDAYTACTTHRAYREAYSPEQARRIMLYQDSWKYDPELLRQFFVFLKEKGHFEKRHTIQTADFSTAL